MRILTVRGCNLASLEAPFEVDFSQEPLAGAGIFAITGPTGAGKSTLLDAICLALFNKVPRLLSAPKGQIGAGDGEALSASDPRALLRHRAAEGYAEVDFVGRDGKSYRARWSVRRSRQRSEGRLLDAKLELTDIATGERIGSTRTDTLAETEARVGLSAEQFGRAVLLAQGDFDAFVRADPNARAALLERLTGTGIYAKAGQAAFRKARALQAELLDLEARIGDRAVMAPADRKEAEQRLTQARDARREAGAAVQALEADHNWHQRRSALARATEEARVRLAEAQAQSDALDPRRAALAQRRRAAVVVPLLQGLRQSEERWRRRGASAADLAELADQAQESARKASAEEKAAVERLAGAEKSVRAAEPELEKARLQDELIARRLSELQPLMDECAEGERIEAEAREEHEKAVRELDDKRRKAAEQGEWVEANQARSDLSMRLGEILADLEEHAGLAGRKSELDEELADAQAASGEKSSALEAAVDALASSRSRRSEAEERCQAARASDAGPQTIAASARRRDLVQAVLPCCIAVQAAAERLTEARHACTASEAERDECAGEAERVDARQGEINRDLPTARARLEEARRARDLSSASEEEASERMRALLRDGEPCPVCGSREHDIAGFGAMFEARRAEDAARVEELERKVSDLDREAAGLQQRRQDLVRRIDAAAQRIEVGAAAIFELEQRNRGVVEALSTALRDAGLDTNSEPEAADREARSRLRDIDAELRELEEKRNAHEEARAALETARSELEQAEEEHRLRERAANNAAQRLASIETALSDVRLRSATVESDLERRLAPHLDWRSARNPGAAVEALVEEWRERNRELENLRQSIPGLTDAVHRAALRRQGAKDGATAVKRKLSECRETIAVHEDERGKLLGGRSVEEVRSGLTLEVESAAEALRSARAAGETAGRAAAAAAAKLDECRQAHGEDAAEVERVRKELDTVLQARSLSLGEVDRDAGADEGELEREAETIAAAERGVLAAQTAHATRSRDLTEHEAAEAPPRDAEQTLHELELARRQEAEAADQLTEADLAIRRDDDARTATALLRSELDGKRDAAQVWLRLDQLIGDATGNGFRRFAQGLTLDRLLVHANAKLAELRPRYTLERVATGDMLLQVVDHELAGEVRGLHNLSGGERFLVSLALALGLAEMSTSRGLRIESLFIDEGFGSLDSASLGDAIAMLEQLHATGRRVGVISHIEEVKERIPVKVAVTPTTRGKSRIEVLSD